MRKSSFLLICFVLALGSCKHEKKIGFTGEAQGTYYAVTYFDSHGRNLQPELDSLLHSFDLSASLWEPGSVISIINKSDSGAEADTVIRQLFRLSKDIAVKTHGAFDYTVGPLVNAWGFGFKKGTDPDSNVIDSLKRFVGYDKISMENGILSKPFPGVSVDFNAIAQGYSVDLIGAYLESHGIHNFLVDVGGEVLARGNKPGNEPWIVGIEQPSESAEDERSLQVKLKLQNKAVATSGSYRKFFVRNGVRYSHTIDPQTGYPAFHSLLSVSVVAGNCATADAYATAFMVMGLEKSLDFLEKNDNLEAFFIYSDPEGNFKTEYTPGFEMFLLD